MKIRIFYLFRAIFLRFTGFIWCLTISHIRIFIWIWRFLSLWRFWFLHLLFFLFSKGWWDTSWSAWRRFLFGFIWWRVLKSRIIFSGWSCISFSFGEFWIILFIIGFWRIRLSHHLRRDCLINDHSISTHTWLRVESLS